VSGYTVTKLDDVPDVRAERGLPGELRMFRGGQVSVTHRRMPPDTGEKGWFGHRHKTQEEIYLVLSGTLTFKIEDELVEAGPGTFVTVEPGTKRAMHNEGSEDVELVIVSTRVEDLQAEIAEMDKEYWPD
jgi:mannose-6-phosphate isomerase-like protein (cupin superfamily)